MIFFPLAQLIFKTLKTWKSPKVDFTKFLLKQEFSLLFKHFQKYVVISQRVSALPGLQPQCHHRPGFHGRPGRCRDSVAPAPPVHYRSYSRNLKSHIMPFLSSTQKRLGRDNFWDGHTCDQSGLPCKSDFSLNFERVRVKSRDSWFCCNLMISRGFWAKH